MLRRSLFKAVAALAGAAGIANADPLNEMGRPSTEGAGRKRPANNFVEAADGTNLFFKDCGSGKPMLFAAPWAMHSAWWEYQVYGLTGTGIRGITYDRRGTAVPANQTGAVIPIRLQTTWPRSSTN